MHKKYLTPPSTRYISQCVGRTGSFHLYVGLARSDTDSCRPQFLRLAGFSIDSLISYSVFRDVFSNLALVDFSGRDTDSFFRRHHLDAHLLSCRIFPTFVFNFQGIPGTHLLCKTLCSCAYGFWPWWGLRGNLDASFSRSVCSASFVSSHKASTCSLKLNPMI